MPPHKETVYLPLEKLDKCSQCSKRKSRLLLCSGCGERIYCSKECQQTDWKAHKVSCGGYIVYIQCPTSHSRSCTLGKTHRIDLNAFYPFLACLSELNHLHAQKPTHNALRHKIINSPNPDSDEIIDCPDGTTALLIHLGEEIPLSEGLNGTEK
ncbi:uncharacterized protein LACBIDRAFT_308645 [Laccaria bicolor S238N-H82]|uniref:Predicted protein n=1 Tax=Laccaria bicolor (strain S238N-H82 / ATCC MYA-4686) TaxID=486041 RepID=B0CWV5_LACBS|nr:uncharacterized protein LACBIDRAFT_308645 [Laccaria bicolor S238N-H82]EDR13138.1 predicted protein [Laccaria bicolor S238N-H82]|eukprot:XP_001875636.1 predicted protein [Laccaria bicolor S238N-H82]